MTHSAEMDPGSAVHVVAPKPLVRSALRRTRDVLGLAWTHGAFHAAVFRKGNLVSAWESKNAVETLEAFEAAFDEATVELRFAGEEVFLVLAHDQFVHQAEQAPGFSESASKAYLRGRVDRYEKEHEPVLWVSQRTMSARQESAFLLHLLPSAFYGRLNSMLLARRLDLTRIVPLSVPLQLVLETLDTPKDKPVLLATGAGNATMVVAARADGQLLFSRTMLARWEVDPARLGVEVNRSLLYAKQQFTALIDRIWLLGTADEAARMEVQSRCGAGKEVAVKACSPTDWLQAVVRLTPRHPVNLVAGYLGRKRRSQFLRRVLIAACWLALTLVSLDAWDREFTWTEQRRHIADLRANEAALTESRDRLIARNAEVEKQRDFVRQAADERLPAVAPRFLTFIASVLPAQVQLTELGVKWDASVQSWIFSMDGVTEGDEETTRETLAAFQKVVAKSPLQARFNDTQRMIAAVPAAGTDMPSAYRFRLEGTLFENKAF